MRHTRLAGAGQGIQERPRGEDRLRAERERDEDVRPAPDPAVEVDLRPALDRVDDLLQHLDARRGPVQLAAAVVRHPDGVRTVIDREPGILGREDPLEDQRQRRPGADLVERVPGQRHAAHVQDLVQLAAVAPRVALGQVRVGILARVEGGAGGCRRGSPGPARPR